MKRLFGIVLYAACSTAAFASTQYRLQDGTFAKLAGPVASAAAVTLDHVPLADGLPATILVQQFDVYAPDAVIQWTGKDGGTQTAERPSIRFYRGGVAGDPSSIAYLAVGSEVHGFVIQHDRRFRIGSQRRVHDRGGARNDDRDIFVEESSDLDEALDGSGVTFHCALDSHDELKNDGSLSHLIPSSARVPVVSSLNTGTATYTIRLVVETDGELYQKLGSNISTVNAFVANIAAAISTIYQRDLRTDIQIAVQNSFTDPASDPFPEPNDGSAGALSTALTNITNRWNTVTPPSAVSHNAVMEWSGKITLGGLADVNALGTKSREYGVLMGLAYGLGQGFEYLETPPAVPDPNGTPNYQAAPDTFDLSYWSLVGIAHELGHIVQSLHTHCTPWTTTDNTTYGLSIDPVARPFVDLCYANESGGCYTNGIAGPNAVPANLPAELGTIMSYCHLITTNPTASYGEATRFTFGQPTETSTKIVHLMMSQLNTDSPSSPVITAPASVAQNSAGNAASVPFASGITHVWSITNGTFTGGLTSFTGDSATFTASTSSPLKLFVTAINGSGNASSDSVNVSVTSGPATPTGLAAAATTGTSVHVSWNASAGATLYHVYRSSDGTNFISAGSSATTFLDDTGGLQPVAVNNSYLYKVRAFDGVNESGDSNIDVATTVIFVNPTIFQLASTVQAVDLTQMRTAVDALRQLANGGVANPGSYTDPTLDTTVSFKAAHLTELRNYIDAARSTLHLTAIAYADPTNSIGSNVTTVKTAQMNELRSGVQ